MLKNAYLLTKIGADTAENERNFAEILPRIGNYPTGGTVNYHGKDVFELEAEERAQQVSSVWQNWQLL